jgi:hypothetical protein
MRVHPPYSLGQPEPIIMLVIFLAPPVYPAALGLTTLQATVNLMPGPMMPLWLQQQRLLFTEIVVWVIPSRWVLDQFEMLLISGAEDLASLLQRTLAEHSILGENPFAASVQKEEVVEF